MKCRAGTTAAGTKYTAAGTTAAGTKYTAAMFTVTTALLLFHASAVCGSVADGGDGASAVDPHLTQANNAFALSLFLGIISNQQGDNVFVCPISVSNSLTMVFLGAKSRTRHQLVKALGLGEFDWDGGGRSDGNGADVRLKSAVRTLLGVLDSDTGNSTLRMASRLYGNRNGQQRSETAAFVADTETYFGASLESLPFDVDADGARQTINDWVSAKTEHKITDLLASGSINAQTALIIVSAVYFKGLWLHQFDQRDTVSQPFHVSASESVNVRMMELSRQKFRYVDSPELASQLLKLDYAGGKISMVVVLPRAVDGLADLERSLSAKILDGILSSLSQSTPRSVDVRLPKFRLESTVDLKQVLTQSLGVVDLFDRNMADLSGIAPNLFVSDAVHKAFVQVDEEGSEAAAATAVLIGMRSMLLPGDIEQFTADRPFIFTIVHNPSGSVLFIGRVVRPTTDN